MRRLFFILPLFLFAQQKNIAVLQFDADNVSDSEARILTNRLNTELFNTGKFVVIERSQIEEVIKEQGFQQSGCVTSECAVEVGKLLGVDAMISGSIGRLGSFYTISARMVDVESGKIINTISKDISGSIDILLTQTMAEIAAELSGTPVKKSAPISPSTGSLTFESIPSGAEIKLSGRVVGTTPITIDDLAPKRYKWDAYLPGYSPQSYFIEVQAGKNTKKNIFLSISSGILVIATNPSNALVIVQGDTIGTTPYSGKFSSKYVSFELRKKDYKTKYVRLLELTAGKTKSVSYTLEKPSGELLIKLEKPIPHNITIGTDSWVFKKDRSFKLGLGKHTIKVSRFAFEEFKTVIYIEDGDKKVLSPKLLPIKVDVNLLMNPDNQVVFSGRELIPKGTKQLKLTYGDYSISSSYPKYEPFSTTVTVDKQLPIDLKLELVPKSKKKALVRSILFPGLGQQYYESKTKALLFSVAAVGMGALLANTYTTYQDENSLVSQYQLDYQNATTTGDIEITWQTYQSQVSTVNDLQSQILMYGATLGATWVINVLDALLFNGLKGD